MVAAKVVRVLHQQCPPLRLLPHEMTASKIQEREQNSDKSKETTALRLARRAVVITWSEAKAQGVYIIV